MQYTSNEIKDLATALAKTQLEMNIADLNKNNPYFKSSYADFQSVVGASRPYLTKNGLSVTQQIISEEDGNSYLYTRLLHISGQWIFSKMKINPTKNDIQAISSNITYLKRICYSALVGVVTGEDDDGEAAVSYIRKDSKNNNTITPEQLEQLQYELNGHPDLCERLLKSYNITSLMEIEKHSFISIINKIRDIKTKMSPNT